MVILKDFENCKIGPDEDEDLCLAQSYEFDGIISP